MSKRLLGFALEVTAPGQDPVRFPFPSWDGVKSHVKRLYKQRFVGSLLPLAWEGDGWTSHPEILEGLWSASVPAFQERNLLFAQAAQLFSVLSKRKEALESVEVVEVEEMLDLIQEHMNELVMGDLEEFDVWKEQEIAIKEEELEEFHL